MCDRGGDDGFSTGKPKHGKPMNPDNRRRYDISLFS